MIVLLRLKPESGAARGIWQYADPDLHTKQTAFKQIAKRTTRDGNHKEEVLDFRQNLSAG